MAMSCLESLPAGSLQNVCAISNTERVFPGNNTMVQISNVMETCCDRASASGQPSSIDAPCQFAFCNITESHDRIEWGLCVHDVLAIKGVDDIARKSVDESCYNATGGTEAPYETLLAQLSTTSSALTAEATKSVAPASSATGSSTIAGNSTSLASTTGASTTVPANPTGTSSTPSPSKSASIASSGITISLGTAAIAALVVSLFSS